MKEQQKNLDTCLDQLQSNKMLWALEYPVAKKIQLLEQTLKNIYSQQEAWAMGDMKARHIPKEHWSASDSYSLGAGLAGRMTRIYLRMLKNTGKSPKLKSKVNGVRSILQTFPNTLMDTVLMPGVKGETWIREKKNPNKKTIKEAGVCLVLGAGNVSALSVVDTYHQLFNENKVVILKIHPVLEYLGEILEKVFRPFIEEGFVRIVAGNNGESEYLVKHANVDSIHMTGSDKTFDAIIYGTGELGKQNKINDNRVNLKPISGELGNITPVIVVPGDWSQSDFDYQTENIFAMMAYFNGYTCGSMRVLVLPKFWEGSKKLVEQLEEKMRNTTKAVNYYPGTNKTYNETKANYPHMTQIGELSEAVQPWLFVKNIDSTMDQAAFRNEYWCAFSTQTFIYGNNTQEYLTNAVKFVNEKLWGSLVAGIIIDPKTQKKLNVEGTFQKAIEDLQYGTVSINILPAAAIVLGTQPWGGYQTAEKEMKYNDVESGNCFVFNTFNLENIEKSVVYGPFKQFPKPLWFINSRPTMAMGKAITKLLISEKFMDILGVAKRLRFN